MLLKLEQIIFSVLWDEYYEKWTVRCWMARLTESRRIQCVYSTAKGTTKKRSWRVSNQLRCPTGVIHLVMWHNGYLSGRSNVCGVLRISEIILCTRTTVFGLAVCVCLQNNAVCVCFLVFCCTYRSKKSEVSYQRQHGRKHYTIHRDFMFLLWFSDLNLTLDDFLFDTCSCALNTF